MGLNPVFPEVMGSHNGNFLGPKRLAKFSWMPPIYGAKTYTITTGLTAESMKVYVTCAKMPFECGVLKC